MEHLKKVMMMKKVMKAMKTRKKNLVSLFEYYLENFEFVFLDEDDDLSEGDVSADPVEGKCDKYLPFLMIYFSFLLFLRTIQR
jgi:hypothetical protein